MINLQKRLENLYKDTPVEAAIATLVEYYRGEGSGNDDDWADGELRGWDIYLDLDDAVFQNSAYGESGNLREDLRGADCLVLEYDIEFLVQAPAHQGIVQE